MSVHRRSLRRRFMMPVSVVFTLVGVLTATAQDAGIKRTILQRADVNEKQEAVMGVAELAKGASAGRHTHHGVESSFIAEGEIELRIEGESPRRLVAGQSFQIPLGKVHDATNVGNSPVKILAVYVVEKGKPLSVAVK